MNMKTPTNEKETPARVGSADGSALWKYHRIGKCSKWVRGQSWVAKFDNEMFCACGYRGIPLHAWMIERPKDARKAIDEMHLPNAKDQTAPNQT